MPVTPSQKNAPLALAIALVLAAPGAASADPACTVITTDTTITVNDGCDYLWQSGNIRVDTDLDDSALMGSLFVGLITTDMLASGTLTINQGASLSTFTSPSALGTILVQDGSTLTALLNNGSIVGENAGLYVDMANTVGTFVNSGSVSATGTGVFNGGTINNLFNRGTIQGGFFDIDNDGVIGSLSNAQVGLRFQGNAPGSYFTFVASPSSFGTLVVDDTPGFAIGALTYGIASGSTLSGGTTYQDVIQNGDAMDTSFDSTVTKTGSYVSGGISYDFSLVFDGLNFDLFVANGQGGARVTSAAVAMGNSSGVSAAQVIDAEPALLSLFDAQTGMQELDDALSQTLPVLTGGSMLAAQGALGSINRVVQARIEGNRGLSTGDEFYGDQYLWLKPFGSWVDQGNRSGVAGFEGDTLGVVAGIDRAPSSPLRLGAAFAYARVDIDGRDGNAPQDVELDVYQLIGYGSYNVDPRTDINVQLDLGLNDTESRRRIAFTGSEASADYDGYTAHLGVGIARVFAIAGQTTLAPALRADYTWLKDDSYRESGAGLLNLSVEDRSASAFVTGIDGKLTHNLTEQTTLVANLGLGFDALDERASIRSAFAGSPGAAFRTKGMHSDPWQSRGGIAAFYTTPDGVELSARLDAERDRKFLNQTLSVRARWAF